MNSHCIRKSTTLLFMSSLRGEFTLSLQNSVKDLLVSGRHVGAHPVGFQHGVSNNGHQKLKISKI